MQPMDEGIRMTDANIRGSTEQRAEEQNGKGGNVEEETELVLQYFNSFVDYWVSGALDTFQTIMKGSLNNS